jgi:WD40 repeat protein
MATKCSESLCMASRSRFQHNKSLTFFFHLCSSPDSARFASCGGDKNVFLWDVGTAQIIRRFSGHTARVNAVAFNFEASVLASGNSYPFPSNKTTQFTEKFDSLAVGQARSTQQSGSGTFAPKDACRSKSSRKHATASPASLSVTQRSSQVL